MIRNDLSVLKKKSLIRFNLLNTSSAIVPVRKYFRSVSFNKTFRNL